MISNCSQDKKGVTFDEFVLIMTRETTDSPIKTETKERFKIAQALKRENTFRPGMGIPGLKREDTFLPIKPRFSSGLSGIQ